MSPNRRHVRPSCGTGSYGAPEVWSPPAEGTLDPRPVDVYAFGCVAFEALTGQVLKLRGRNLRRPLWCGDSFVKVIAVGKPQKDSH